MAEEVNDDALLYLQKTLPTWEAILTHSVAIQHHQPSKKIQVIHCYGLSLN